MNSQPRSLSCGRNKVEDDGHVVVVVVVKNRTSYLEIEDGNLSDGKLFPPFEND